MPKSLNFMSNLQFIICRNYGFTKSENKVSSSIDTSREELIENGKMPKTQGIKMFSNSSKPIICDENSGIVYNTKD